MSVPSHPNGKKTSVAEGLTRIHVVYPKPEQPIYEDSTFLMGQVSGLQAGAGLEANGQAVPLSPHGFFAWKLPVHAGMNPVKLSVFLPHTRQPEAQELFALHGEPPVTVLPSTPLALHIETLHPAGDVWLSRNDTLTVAVSASEGAAVSLCLPTLGKVCFPLSPLVNSSASAAESKPPAFIDNRELVFAQWHQTRPKIPTRGYYQATIPAAHLFEAAAAAGLNVGTIHTPMTGPALESASISSCAPRASGLQEAEPNTGVVALPMRLHVQHGTAQLEHPLNGHLTLLDGPRPAVLKTDAVSRTAPVSGARLTPQMAGTVVAVDGLSDDWARIRLSGEESFYLPLASLQFMPPAANQSMLAVVVPEPARLDVIRTEGLAPHHTVVRLQFSRSGAGTSGISGALPIRIEPVPIAELNRLQVRCYGVTSQCDFIHYTPEDALVNFVDWRQVADGVVEVIIDLHRPLASYDYAWRDGQWELDVKALPAAWSDVRILIDPGHGGTESGSVGLNGLPEKTLNLTVSKLLQQALQAEGFRQVLLTRETDETLSLEGRSHQAVSRQADVILSLHHNALPDGRDPLAIEGACTFYYHLFAKPLAEALLSGLTGTDGAEATVKPDHFVVPNYGLFYDSLHMTRIHQATAVLVEIGFFTNPTEFERLINPAFQQAAAHRLARALKAYCQARA